MSATNTQNATISKPVRLGFPQVTCIKCGNADAVVKLDITDLDTFSCSECEEEFTAADVREFVGAWQQVLAWIEQAPAVEE